MGKTNFLQVDGEMEPEVHHGVGHHFGSLPNSYIYATRSCYWTIWKYLVALASGQPSRPWLCRESGPIIDRLDIQVVKLSILTSTIHQTPRLAVLLWGGKRFRDYSGAIISVPVANITRFRDGLGDVECFPGWQHSSPECPGFEIGIEILTCVSEN